MAGTLTIIAPPGRTRRYISLMAASSLPSSRQYKTSKEVATSKLLSGKGACVAEAHATRLCPASRAKVMPVHARSKPNDRPYLLRIVKFAPVPQPQSRIRGRETPFVASVRKGFTNRRKPRYQKCLRSAWCVALNKSSTLWPSCSFSYLLELLGNLVRKGGFEPPRPCGAQAPEACASASSATSACPDEFIKSNLRL